jgi:hypothetical protein
MIAQRKPSSRGAWRGCGGVEGWGRGDERKEPWRSGCRSSL